MGAKTAAGHISEAQLSSSPGRVLISGAGPVALLVACELGVRGVPVTVFEKRLSQMRHPRANTHGARSMEIYRRHGVAERMRAQAWPADHATDVGYFTTMLGHEISRIPLPAPEASGIDSATESEAWPTPEPQFRGSQKVLDPLLLARALSFPTVEVRFGWEVTRFEQDDDGVEVSVRHLTGLEETVTGELLVGADGGQSTVRRGLGIGFAGPEGLTMDFLGGKMVATVFRSQELLNRFPHSPTWMHWMMSPRGRGVVVLIDPRTAEFLVHLQLNPGETPSSIDIAGRLQALFGEEVPYQLLSASPWSAGVGLVAERYGEHRVWCVGDAVHLFTPTGGFGLNTGIEDAFNLGWKLAAVAKGIAPLSLLESYDTERRPIGIRNTTFALKLAKNQGFAPVSPLIDEPTREGELARQRLGGYLDASMRQEFLAPGIQLGARYDCSPLTIRDEEVSPPDEPDCYRPSGAPGGRLPHVWLAEDESLFDQLGQELTLIAIGSGTLTEGFVEAAQRRGVELTVIEMPTEHRLHRLVDAELILVRPDMHIAWRGHADPGPEQSLGVIDTVLGARASTDERWAG